MVLNLIQSNSCRYRFAESPRRTYCSQLGNIFVATYAYSVSVYEDVAFSDVEPLPPHTHTALGFLRSKLVLVQGCGLCKDLVHSKSQPDVNGCKVNNFYPFLDGFATHLIYSAWICSSKTKHDINPFFKHLATPNP